MNVETLPGVCTRTTPAGQIVRCFRHLEDDLWTVQLMTQDGEIELELVATKGRILQGTGPYEQAPARLAGLAGVL